MHVDAVARSHDHQVNSQLSLQAPQSTAHQHGECVSLLKQMYARFCLLPKLWSTHMCAHVSSSVVSKLLCYKILFSLKVSCNVHMDIAILVPVALSPALDTNLAQK